MKRNSTLNYFLTALLLFLTLNSTALFAGDGSKENPFTIAEALKIEDQNNLYWIKGYVVGEIEDYSNNKYFVGFQPPFVGRCNWLIADAKTENVLNKCIPIQISTGDLCDTLNLDWNAKFWRKEVMIQGKFKEFYARKGLKNVAEIKILSPYPLQVEEADPVDPIDPVDPNPESDLPTYVYEDFNRIEKERPNEDIGTTMDRFTILSGWYGENVTTAVGKIRLGFEPTKGWIQTPAANLSGNGGNYVISFDAWDFGNAKEHKRFNLYVHKGKEHIQTQEVIITAEQTNYSFKGRYGGDDVVFTFIGQQNTKNRFYLDNVEIKVDQSAVINPMATYKEDFEDGIKELAVDFLTTYEEGLYVGANGPWNFVGAVISEHASSKKIGLKGAVIRLSENEEGTPGYLEMKKDKANGIGEISFFGANYGVESGAVLAVSYSTNGGKNWRRAADGITLTSTMTEYKYTVNVEGNVRVRIEKTDASTMRACVDDISITSYSKSSSVNNEFGDEFQIKKTEDGCEVYTSAPTTVSVYNTSGMLVDQVKSAEGWNPLKISDKGVYIIKAGNRTQKIVR